MSSSSKKIRVKIMLLLPSHFLEHAVFASQVFTEFIAKVTKQNKEGVERFEMISGNLSNTVLFLFVSLR